MRKLGAVIGLVAAMLGVFLVSVAFAQHYHVHCVSHGFVHGSSPSDNVFWSRIEAGCGNPGSKYCRLYEAYGTMINSDAVARDVNVTCNAQNSYEYGEAAASSYTDFNGVFHDHGHGAH